MNLSNNWIDQIDQDAFNSTPRNLITDLSKNNFSFIAEKMFHDVNVLAELDLKMNSIQ